MNQSHGFGDEYAAEINLNVAGSRQSECRAGDRTGQLKLGLQLAKTAAIEEDEVNSAIDDTTDFRGQPVESEASHDASEHSGSGHTTEINSAADEGVSATDLSATDLSDTDVSATDVSATDFVSDDSPAPARGSWFRRSRRFVAKVTWTLFCLASLVVSLAILTAIPIIQLVAFGYMLDVAGRLARGGTLKQSVYGLEQAGSIGMAIAALFLASLPVHLLVHWEAVSAIIEPGSDQSMRLRVLAITCAMAAMVWLLWVWARGGRLTQYLWPEPKRFLREGWRWSTWSVLPDRLWTFTGSLELPRMFWLGARALIGTLVWLLPAMVIIGANRNGTTGLAGLVGGVSLVALGIAMFYLPMLQAHYAAQNRLSALFDVRTIRTYFRRAPWAWFAAMFCGLVLMPIPLYLLKIEATPKELVWLPSLVFVAFMLPARIAAGLTLRRARQKPDPVGWWPAISRWAVRGLMIPVVATYLLFVYVSQYTSWDGLQTWVQQHAILVPVPFVGI